MMWGVVSSKKKSFNNRNTITHDHDHILSDLRFEGAVKSFPLSVNAWLESHLHGSGRTRGSTF